jgi:hypothetical protein
VANSRILGIAGTLSKASFNRWALKATRHPREAEARGNHGCFYRRARRGMRSLGQSLMLLDMPPFVHSVRISCCDRQPTRNRRHWGTQAPSCLRPD